MSVKQKPQGTYGFTIIEMIVVIAIIGVVTTLVLFSNARLNSNILVSNAAYEIGLIIREAQVSGLGVKAVSDGGSGVTFATSHGVYIDMARPNTVTMYADKNKNGMYDQSGAEMTQEYVISNSRSGSILGVCTKESLHPPATDEYCTNVNTKSSIDIVFTRPNPEAFFKVRDNAGDLAMEYVGGIVITVGYANDVCRSVVIEKTGAVETNATYCVPMQ